MSKKLFAAMAALLVGAAALTAEEPVQPKLPQYVFQVTLTERDADGKERILASPTLIAQDGRTAYFMVGGEIPFKSVDGGVQFKPVGVGLKFTAKRAEDRKLNVALNFEHTSVVKEDPLHLNSLRSETVHEDVEAKEIELKLPKIGAPGVEFRVRIDVKEKGAN